MAAQNVSGTNSFENVTTNLWIIRNVCVYYGGDPPDAWFLRDESAGVMLAYGSNGALIDTLPANNVWEELHLCWAPGQSWSSHSTYGWDFSIHGYELSLP